MTHRYYRRFIDPCEQYRRWIDPRVKTLPLAAVVSYLRDKGWREVPTDRDGFRVFEEPHSSEVKGGPFCQFVPDSEEGDDYGERMFELITGLAEVEKRQAVAVIDDILAQSKRPSENGSASEQSAAAELSRR
jgi:hypothetical protein